MEQKQQVVETKKTNKIIDFEKNISDSVQNRITTLVSDGRLDLPKNYSVGNALASAWLIIQDTVDSDKRPALSVCTKESVANALLEMTTLGLNPAKKQCYFIVYGNKLGLYVSYFGKCATIKRLKGIDTEPIATIIYEGDDVEIGHNELGEEIVEKHTTSWKNKLNGKRVGAYATVTANGIKRSALMTIIEIKESWTKNPSPSNKRDHVTFEGEFMKRTVINRLIKMILQTSNDDDLLADTLIKNEDSMYQNEEYTDITDFQNNVQEEIDENANTGEYIDFDTSTRVEEQHKEDVAINTQPTKKDKYF